MTQNLGNCLKEVAPGTVGRNLMTICASVKVRDGLVLATDSMSQIQGTDPVTGVPGVIKNYGNARKLFQIAAMPVGVMSYGIGNIGNMSIQGFMREFRTRADTVAEITRHLFQFIKSPYDSQFGSLNREQQPSLGFYVAGYSKSRAFAEEWEFLLPRDAEPKAVRHESIFGASWRGIELPFVRLYQGFDPRIRQKLMNAGLTQQQVEDALSGFASPIVFDGMPVQDAINFATYIVRTTVGMATFETGPPTCGGPLQIATILPDSGFGWVMKPTLAVQDL